MPQTMSDPRELFVHELGDILYAERTVEKLLPKVQKEVRDEELAKRIEQHVGETKQQIENLKKVFEQLGKRAKAEKCPGIEGIQREHDEFVEQESPSPEILELFVTGSTARIEHYEIASYTGLIATAKALGENEAAELLTENLKQEQAMLRDGEKIAKRLVKEGAKAAKAA